MALYLKYRPKDFESIVGQDFVKNTLRKAVNEGKTVGAYLFCGPRWTWKTSTARILAKAINCENPNNWNPCNKCKICEAINNESLVDVIEIDAASNTWVDNIRDLIEKAKFSPTNAKYKVYIIDEVHMLSKWAFNALLKILEEPPKYLKFILATTETHKVPETIISRCQRYDFKNISLEDIKNRLKFIAWKENIEIDSESLDYIAKASNWWLRNAISLFEQLIIDNKITYENIIKTLNLTDKDFINSFIQKLENKDKEIINLYEQLINDWKNIKLFIKDLIFSLKDKIFEFLKEEKDYSNLLKIIEELDETQIKLKNSQDENITFLIWILKILNPKNNKTDEIEKNFTNTQKTTQPKQEKILEPKKIPNPKKEELDEIKIDDIWDIFWVEDNKKVENKNNINSLSFDKDKLIQKLKELKAKWALTMSLRWANFNLTDDKLEIIFKTNFALNSVNNADNIALIKKALEELWFENINLILKN